MPRFYLLVPDPVQIAEIAAGAHNAKHQMPPTGMTLGIDDTLSWLGVSWPLGGRRTPLYVAGNPPAGAEDDWFWGTVGELVTAALIPDSDELANILETLASRFGSTVSAVLSLPLIKKGMANGIMRWIRVVHRGILGGGVEQFQFKVDLGLPGADPDLDEGERDALAAQLATVWAANWGAYSTHWSALIQFTEIGVAQVTQTDPTNVDGTGGNQEATMTSWVLFPVGVGAVQGGGAGPDLPYEVAVAVSLQTDHRGPSGRGRLYLPAPHTGAMTTAGIFSTSTVAECGNLISAYLTAIKDDTPHVPVVVSPRRIILNEVTSINVGQVPDSQRRRRRSQDEARVVTTLA